MEQKSERLYPSAPLENIDLEQRLAKKYTKQIGWITISTILKKWYHISKIKIINQKKNIKIIKP